MGAFDNLTFEELKLTLDEYADEIMKATLSDSITLVNEGTGEIHVYKNKDT